MARSGALVLVVEGHGVSCAALQFRLGEVVAAARAEMAAVRRSPLVWSSGVVSASRRRAQRRWRSAAWCMEARRWSRPGWAAVAVVRECQAVRVLRGVGMLLAKAIAGIMLVEMTASL